MPPSRHDPRPNPLEGPGDYTTTSVVHSDTYPAIDPTKLDLSGKSVFISGASKGLGRAITLSFAKAGASRIAAGARSDLSSLENEVQEAASAANRPRPNFLTVKFDVSDAKSTEGAAVTVEKAFGRVDIVVNNAGVIGCTKLLMETDPDEWWFTWSVNVKGPYLVTRAFLPLMLKGGDKTFLTVNSVGALLHMPTLSDYQPSKLATLRFSEHICAEYGDKGIIAYSIHPGNMLTDMLSEVMKGKGSEGLNHIFVDKVELAADTIAYLTSERREWLRGRYINATWNMPELMAKKDEIQRTDKLKVRLILP
ncbi:putative short-chain type dehydrogenase [Patellaria atrata CBS 101060]|uniref:Short-chain type dehydrogenase n=1 Tax=Patellaria atrata CBS 101060 TaxID=1346257 RepID=A0A9P4SCN1_9PEZI|nr:putative short-chain type dehydrogenase [Patellaria atrata CBS 101060]